MEDLCSTHVRFSDFSVRSYIQIGSGTYPKKNEGLVFVVVRHRREAGHYTPFSGEIENVPLFNTSSRRDS
jgi:hypothetical protein